MDRIAVLKTVRMFLNKIRPPSKAIRSKVDFGFRFFGQTVELVEIRPKRTGVGKIEHAFAKGTFVASRGIWKVYWMRGNLKWHPYEPPTARTLKEYLDLVQKDEHHCFFG